MMNEPEIIINGINVGPGCACTMRVAIEVFYGVLIEDGCGDDEHGITMTRLYKDRINDVRRAMGVIK